MAIAHMYNPFNSTDLNDRINLFNLICNESLNVNIGNPANIIIDKTDFITFINNCGNQDNFYIFFIHTRDASVEDFNNWPQNVFAIFYRGEGTYGETPNDNIKILNAWFPEEIEPFSQQFNTIVTAVSAAATGDVNTFSNTNVNN